MTALFFGWWLCISPISVNYGGFFCLPMKTEAACELAKKFGDRCINNETGERK